MSTRQFIVTVNTNAPTPPTVGSVRALLTTTTSFLDSVDVQVEDYTTQRPQIKESDTPWKVRIDGYVAGQFVNLEDAATWVKGIDKPKGVAIIHDTGTY